jgi:hypothetical protein
MLGNVIATYILFIFISAALFLLSFEVGMMFTVTWIGGTFIIVSSGILTYIHSIIADAINKLKDKV